MVKSKSVYLIPYFNIEHNALGRKGGKGRRWGGGLFGSLSICRKTPLEGGGGRQGKKEKKNQQAKIQQS